MLQLTARGAHLCSGSWSQALLPLASGYLFSFILNTPGMTRVTPIFLGCLLSPLSVIPVPEPPLSAYIITWITLSRHR